jgi:hypothetical protein
MNSRLLSEEATVGNQVSPEVYIYPPSASSPTVVEHHHHHYITVEKKSDDAKTVFGAIAAIGTLFGGIAALMGAANNSNTSSNANSHRPQQQYSQPQYSQPAPQYYPPPQRVRTCWQEPRQEYLGRFYSHSEQIPVYDQYGRYRGYRMRDYYQHRYRTYYVRVCD